MNALDCLHNIGQAENGILAVLTVQSLLLEELEDQEIEVRKFEEEVDRLKEELKTQQLLLKNFLLRINQFCEHNLVLNPNRDPDPYGLHGISISDRIETMRVLELEK